jgi:hypothetical protein
MLLDVIRIFREILVVLANSTTNTGMKMLGLFFQLAELFRANMGSTSAIDAFLSAGLVLCVFLLVLHFIWGSIKTILLIILLLVLLFMLLIVIL